VAGVIALVRGATAFKWLVLCCPCGCGEIRRISTSSTVFPGWYLRYDPKGYASLYPSVVLKTECRAHFILRRNRALLF
jgi:hypothetical protein